MGNKGFSLIEIAIAIALVAITITFFVKKLVGNWFEEGKAQATVKMIRKLELAVNTYYEDTGYFPTDAKQLWKNDLATDGWSGPYVRPPFDDPTYSYFPKTPYGGDAYLECSDGNYVRLKMVTTKGFCSILDKRYDNDDLSSGRFTYDDTQKACYYHFARGSYVRCK